MSILEKEGILDMPLVKEALAYAVAFGNVSTIHGGDIRYVWEEMKKYIQHIEEKENDYVPDYGTGKAWVGGSQGYQDWEE